MLLQIWQHTFLQHCGNGIAVLLCDGRPIGFAAQVGHHRKRIKTVASFGCKGWIGGRWAVQIQTEIFRQLVIFENILQQAFVAWAQDHHVVRHIVVFSVGAKVPHKQAR